jgi:hypothetical protein
MSIPPPSCPTLEGGRSTETGKCSLNWAFCGTAAISVWGWGRSTASLIPAVKWLL